MHPFVSAGGLNDKQLFEKINDIQTQIQYARMHNAAPEAIQQLYMMLDTYETTRMEKFHAKIWADDEKNQPSVINIGHDDEPEEEEIIAPIDPEEAMDQIEKMMRNAKERQDAKEAETLGEKQKEVPVLDPNEAMDQIEKLIREVNAKKEGEQDGTDGKIQEET